jgi:peptidyl-tRNA hydrolase, PTH1 family
MKLVIGLGNPGASYAVTRHNAGFRFVDRVAGDAGARWRKAPLLPCMMATAKVRGVQVLLGKPLAFMNRSGPVVRTMLRRQRVDRADLMVVYDDVALPAGRVRIRPRGGAGGHNGLQSIIEALGSEDFPRIRIGVGGPAEGASMIEHVLQALPPDEDRRIEEVLDEASIMVAKLIRDGLETVMNTYNGRM